MSNKLAIIGRGTAGALASAHFYRHTDWEIDWYFDPNITPQAVGEGANVDLPENLFESLGFFHDDLKHIDGTFKQGIYKIGWGDRNEDFLHSFSPPFISYHFNAHKLQDYILNQLRYNKRINIVETNIQHDQIDSNFIMDCSGRPKDYSLFETADCVPVNSVYVTQCYWDSFRFQHTLTIARPHGWVFGIPLTNRCSIGYLYNNKVSTLDQIKEDVKSIFQEYKLEPSNTTNSFSFNNYYRKKNFDERVVYNGNASFFLEPLEATSISVMIGINRHAFDLWNNNMSNQECNIGYIDYMEEVMTTLSLHYLAGSRYKTDFWESAYNKSKPFMEYAIKEKKFMDHVRKAQERLETEKIYGTWKMPSFSVNLEKLNLYEKLFEMERNLTP